MPNKHEVTRSNVQAAAGLHSFYPVGMLIAAVVLVIAAAFECGEGQDTCDGDGEGFAVIAGCVVVVLDLFYMYKLYNKSISDSVDIILCLVFVVIWATIAGITTFDGPFVAVGNGYMAAWVGFLASLGNLVFSAPFAAKLKNNIMHQGLPIVILLTGSIVLIVAIIDDGCCSGSESLGLVAAIVSLVMTIMRIILGAAYDKPFAYFLAVWWLVLGLIITFDLFEAVGNGYFATAACILSSCYMASQVRKAE